jgi:hypothetical protein
VLVTVLVCSHIEPPLQTEDPEGSLIFSYVQTDDYCDSYEINKEVTTSKRESTNHLVQLLLKNVRNRQKVRNRRSNTRFHALMLYRS